MSRSVGVGPVVSTEYLYQHSKHYIYYFIRSKKPVQVETFNYATLLLTLYITSLGSTIVTTSDHDLVRLAGRRLSRHPLSSVHFDSFVPTRLPLNCVA
jgi:hypothetical protein